MSNHAIENPAEKNSVQLRCESCGVKFGCDANSAECWCFKVEVEPEILANLRERYVNCLCAECLSRTSKK